MPKVAYSEAERERIRNELVSVALELMARQGIQHTTVEQIYRAVGISRSFFYTFFPTKEDLIVESLYLQQPRILEYARSLMAGPELSWREAVRRFLRSCCYGEQHGIAVLTVEEQQLIFRRLSPESYAAFREKQARLFGWSFGSMILETSPDCAAGETIGSVTPDYAFSCGGERVELEAVQAVWESKLEPVMPDLSAPGQGREHVRKLNFAAGSPLVAGTKFARPRALIPVFPGTNCEYDTARSLRRAGAEPEILVIRNLSPADVAESVERAAEAIARSQMLVLPGGFSGGDEPDGSAKLITSFFRSPRLADAVQELLDRREGLMLGICNGFQALIKLGLVPFGRIVETDENCPTLTYNAIGRHQSMLVRTRVSSTLSPWLSRCRVGDIHTVAISHGEGRFVCPEPLLSELERSGRLVTQYVDLEGEPAMDVRYNPNGSVLAVEAVCSPDGRVLGKMGHTERSGPGLYKNIPDAGIQPIFEGGVDYFK